MVRRSRNFDDIYHTQMERINSPELDAFENDSFENDEIDAFENGSLHIFDKKRLFPHDDHKHHTDELNGVFDELTHSCVTKMYSTDCPEIRTMPSCVRTFSISLSLLTTRDFDVSTPRGYLIQNCFKQAILQVASVSFRNRHQDQQLSQVDVISTAQTNTVTGVVVTFSVQAEEVVLDRLSIQMTDDCASGFGATFVAMIAIAGLGLNT